MSKDFIERWGESPKSLIPDRLGRMPRLLEEIAGDNCSWKRAKDGRTLGMRLDQ